MKSLKSFTRTRSLYIVVAVSFTLVLAAAFTARPNLATSDPAANRSTNSVNSGVLGQNGKIAFVSNRDGNDEIYVMNPDGTDQTNITNNPASDTDPAWSPYGTKIAFTSTRDGNPEIYVMDADGSNVRRLTNNSGPDLEPAWSPHGDWIAFASNRLCGQQIFVMRPDGSNIYLGSPPFGCEDRDSQPAWSPDGTKIAYKAFPTGSSYVSDIFVVTTTSPSSSRVNLTNTFMLDDDPAWSPDGTKIAWQVSDFFGYGGIITMAPDGTQLQQLTHRETDQQPAWSPDGTKIAISSPRDANYDIYVLNSDGSDSSNPVRLTNNAASDSQPAWQPIPAPCAPPPPNLLNWWPADVPIVSSVYGKDLVGHNLVGAGGGGYATYGPGKVGTAFTFERDPSWFELSSYAGRPALYRPYSALTLDVWVFPTANGHDSSGRYGLTVLSNTDGSGFALRVKDGLPQADLRTESMGLLQTFGTQPLPLSQWSHLAMTYDGLQVSMYLNGNLLGSATAFGSIATFFNGHTTPMIGNEPDQWYPQAGGFGWQGSIDEVEFFDRALTQSEIQSIVNAGGGKCRPDQPTPTPTPSATPTPTPTPTVQVTVQTDPSGLSFTADGSPFNSSQTFSWTVGSNHTISTTSPQDGAPGTRFEFYNWSDGGNQTHVITVPSGGATYTVNFGPEYLLTMNAGAGGTVNPPSGYYDGGSNVSISATPNGGYNFAGWTGSGSGSYSGTNNPASVTMNGPITETGSFTQNNIQAIVQTNPGGLTFTVDGTAYNTTQTFSWNSGSSHTISTTSPLSGGAGKQYVWSNWSDGGAISHSIAPATSTTFTANFGTQYLLTMNAGAGGTVNPPSGFYNAGQQVSISATPSGGYNFAGWAGSGSGSYSGVANPASVTINGPISETGSFVTAPILTCIAPPPNMIVWYPADDPQNGDFPSDIAGGHSAHLKGGAGFSAGQVGQAFNFPGGISAVHIWQGTLRQNFGAFTVDAWIYPTTSGHAASPATAYGLTVFSNTDGGGLALRIKDGLLQADVRTEGLGVFQTFGPPVPLNTWSHVAMTYNGSQVVMYLNGSAVGSAPAGGGVSTAGNQATYAMIGNEPNGWDAQQSGFGFVGRIDEFEFFNRALSAAEIQSIVNAGSAGKCKPGGNAAVNPLFSLPGQAGQFDSWKRASG